MTKCPPGTILNPKTNNCVLVDGRIGKSILLEQKLKRRSPKSRSRKKCPPGTIRNPKTNNCVLVDGRIGKSILLEQKLKRRSPKSRSRKKCPPDKILNPRTKKCVLKDGRVGKFIVLEQRLEQKLKGKTQISGSVSTLGSGSSSGSGSGSGSGSSSGSGSGSGSSSGSGSGSGSASGSTSGSGFVLSSGSGSIGSGSTSQSSLTSVFGTVSKNVASKSKSCPPDKILNPKTGLCVLKDGRVGKFILLEQKFKESQQKKSQIPIPSPPTPTPTHLTPTSSIIKSIINKTPGIVRRPPLKINMNPTIINGVPIINPTPVVSSFFPVKEDCSQIDNWKKLRTLGKGSYGIVYLVLSKYDNREYALKVQKNNNSFLTEIEALNDLQKTNIVPKIYAAWTCKKQAFIVMEKLKDFEYSKFSHHKIWKKVGESLDIIRDAGWLHVDTHDENVMCTDDNNLVIIDFGFAVKRTRLHNLQTYPDHLMSAKNWYNFPLTWEFLESIQNYNYQSSFNPFYMIYDLVKHKIPTKEEKIAYETAYKNYYNGRKKLCNQGCRYAC